MWQMRESLDKAYGLISIKPCACFPGEWSYEGYLGSWTSLNFFLSASCLLLPQNFQCQDSKLTLSRSSPLRSTLLLALSLRNSPPCQGNHAAACHTQLLSFLTSSFTLFCKLPPDLKVLQLQFNYPDTNLRARLS